MSSRLSLLTVGGSFAAAAAMTSAGCGQTTGSSGASGVAKRERLCESACRPSTRSG